MRAFLGQAREVRGAPVVVAVLVLVAACGGADRDDPPPPDTGGWTELAAPPLETPVLRTGQAAVWTGDQALVWGGSSPRADGCAVAVTDDGAAWTPGSPGSWTAMAAAPVAARSGADLLWTGTEAILVGGVDPWAVCESRPAGALDVAAFTPDAGAGSWARLPDLPWTPGTVVATSAWADGEVLVWSPVAGAWALHPGDAAWTPLPVPPLPASVGVPPEGLASVNTSVHSLWTGREWMLLGAVFGAEGVIDVGLAYDPSQGSWRDVDPGPAAAGSGVVWTGEQVLAFGLDRGVERYDVVGDRWTRGAADPLQTAPQEAVYGAPLLAWTGRELVVWGGPRSRDFTMCIDGSGPDDPAFEYGGSCNPATGPLGAAYDPDADTWRTIGDGPWQRRSDSAVVWTGTSVLLAGGRDLEESRHGRPPPFVDRPESAVATFTPGR